MIILFPSLKVSLLQLYNNSNVLHNSFSFMMSIIECFYLYNCPISFFLWFLSKTFSFFFKTQFLYICIIILKVLSFSLLDPIQLHQYKNNHTPLQRSHQLLKINTLNLLLQENPFFLLIEHLFHFE